MRCSLGKKGKKGEVLPRSTGGDGVAESGHETQDNERTFSDNLPPAILINRFAWNYFSDNLAPAILINRFG